VLFGKKGKGKAVPDARSEEGGEEKEANGISFDYSRIGGTEANSLD